MKCNSKKRWLRPLYLAWPFNIGQVYGNFKKEIISGSLVSDQLKEGNSWIQVQSTQVWMYLLNIANSMCFVHHSCKPKLFNLIRLTERNQYQKRKSDFCIPIGLKKSYNTKNGPVHFFKFKFMFRHWNCFLSSVVMDGKMADMAWNLFAP